MNNEFYSNAKGFGRSNMQRFTLMCQDPNSEQSKALERAQWYLRMYWQARTIFDGDPRNFIIFDTLTYDDEYLPKLSRYFDVPESVDFSIVDYEDIKGFLKRLRINLQRHFNVDKGRLKYFIASEYGDDKIYKDDYGRTHKGTVRPHYHCLFYVDARGDITPREFVEEVHYSWKNGNTDNYKTFKVKTPHYGKYLDKNIFGRNYSRNDDTSLRQVTNYVSKYIRKSDKYEQLINNRVWNVYYEYIKTLPKEIILGPKDELLRKFWKRQWDPNQDPTRPDSLRINYSEKELFKIIRDEIKNKIKVFHKQSQGFGYYGIEIMSEEDRDYLIRSGNMRLMDNGKVVREIPCPMYYLRKLFYNYRVSSDGRVQWYLTDSGLAAMKQMTYGKIARLSSKFEEWYLNLKNDEVSDIFDFDIDDIQSAVVDILDGRNFTDLATYALCYRGRILYQYHTKDDSLPSIEDIMELQNEWNVDSEMFFLKGSGNVSFVYDDELPWTSKVNIKYNEFYRVYCINENTKFEGESWFRNFDMLLDIIKFTERKRDVKKSDDMKFMIDLKERLKNYGFSVKI